jgi:multiple sugar transport system permease protein
MYLKFGYATAAAWIMGSMLIGFTMYQLKILREVRFSTAQEKEV